MKYVACYKNRCDFSLCFSCALSYSFWVWTEMCCKVLRARICWLTGNLSETEKNQENALIGKRQDMAQDVHTFPTELSSSGTDFCFDALEWDWFLWVHFGGSYLNVFIRYQWVKGKWSSVVVLGWFWLSCACCWLCLRVWNVVFWTLKDLWSNDLCLTLMWHFVPDWLLNIKRLETVRISLKSVTELDGIWFWGTGVSSMKVLHLIHYPRKIFIHFFPSSLLSLCVFHFCLFFGVGWGVRAPPPLSSGPGMVG